MTPEQYLVDSERTLSKFPDGLGLSSDTAKSLGNVIKQAIDVCQQLDALKKNIYYGKPMVDGAVILSDADTMALEPDELEALQKFDSREVDLLHAALGKLTEAGEVMENVFAFVSSDKQNYDVKNTIEEVGDGFWYDAILLRDAGVSIEECMDKNINKLLARYPEKFNTEDALNRDTEAERKAMEDAG